MYRPKSLQGIKPKPYYDNMCQPKSLLGINLRLQVERSIPEARAFGPRFRTQALLGELDGMRLFPTPPKMAVRPPERGVDPSQRLAAPRRATSRRGPAPRRGGVAASQRPRAASRRSPAPRREALKA